MSSSEPASSETESRCRILELPTEVLWQICAALLPTLLPGEFRIFREQQDAKAAIAAMHNLALSCRRMFSIAIQIRQELYPVDKIPPFQLVMIPYALRILRDAGLASREVSFRYNARDDLCGVGESINDYKMLYQAAERLNIQEPSWYGIGVARPRFMLSDQDWESPLGHAIIRNMQRSPAITVPLGLILAHLPNLNSITIECAHFSGSVGYMEFMNKTLRTVRHLDLSSPDKHSGINSSFGLDRYDALLKACPNLEAFATFNCCGGGEVSLPKLRLLTLDHADFNVHGLRRLLEGCTKLEFFRYTASWNQSRLQAADIIRSLSPAQFSLRYLTIHTYTYTREGITDLKQFPSLQTVSLTQSTLCSDTLDARPDKKLSDILPSSLQMLWVFEADDTFLDSLGQLGEDIQFGKFPGDELRDVQIWIRRRQFPNGSMDIFDADPNPREDCTPSKSGEFLGLSHDFETRREALMDLFSSLGIQIEVNIHAEI